MSEARAASPGVGQLAAHDSSIALARRCIRQLQLTDLEPLLHVVQTQTEKTHLHLAVFGRLKAGKSSFLNQLLGQPLLPVGVVPVTSVVTEISHGEKDCAQVTFQKNGGTQSISLAEIASYTSEANNPKNGKEVALVSVALSSLAKLRGIKLVDTPGLESIFEHNTQTALTWLPNVDLALVAVAVDPPLTQHDLALIERLQQFTPNVSLLLTKVDMLDETARQEVLTFVRTQLKEKFPAAYRVFPFSVRPGYESLREAFAREYLAPTLASFESAHTAVLERKLRTLLRSILDYLRLALHAAQADEHDREKLRTLILGAEESLADQKLQFQLLARHAAAQTRPLIEQRLRRMARAPLEATLQTRLSAEFAGWRGSFGKTLACFERWLRGQLESELAGISTAEAAVFQTTLRDLQRQCRENLQSFREQLSERVLRLSGAALRTSQMEIAVRPPTAPDVSVGRIFDHNWELLSAVIPMWLVRGALKRRFAEKVESEVEKHLSRLTSQWEERLCAAIQETGKEAGRQFDELVATVRRLLSQTDRGATTRLQTCAAEIADALQPLEAATPD